MIKDNTTRTVPSPVHGGRWLLAAALLLGGGCKRQEGLPQLPSSTRAAGAREVATVRVQATSKSEIVKATGTTAPRSTTKIMALVPGKVMVIPVKEGQKVTAGQVLATLDQRNFKLTLEQAKAGLAGAKVQLDALTREKLRFEQLLKERATSPSQYEQILDKFKGAQVLYRQAEVGLAQAQKALSDTVLRSPYDGVVAQKLASVGDYATAMPPTVLMVLMETKTLDLRVSLPEPDLPLISEGAKVEAELRSINRTVRTNVSRVVRTVDPLTRSFSVIIEVDNPAMDIPPGVFAEVRITASAPRQRLLLPKDAVVDESNGVYSVMVVVGDRARRREVHVTASGQEQAEILSGLQAGDVAILDPGGLLDGDEVKARPAAAGAAAAPAAGGEGAAGAVR